MPKLIQSISIGNPDRTGFSTTVNGQSIIDSLRKEAKVRKELGRPSTLTLVFQSGTEICLNDSTQLKRRRIVRLNYDDGSIEEYRITFSERETSGSKDVTVKAQPIWLDLGDRRIRRTLSSGFVMFNIPFYSVTVQSLLTDIFSASYNAPSLFVLGTVDASFSGQEINVMSNNSSHLSMISELCKVVGCEWEAVYNGTNDNYEINFVPQGDVGGGLAEASQRPIEQGNAEGNRITMSKKNEKGSFFSRVVPTGGSEGDTFGVQRAVFPIDTAIYDGTTNTNITLQHDAILKAGYPNVSHFGDPSVGIFSIVSTGTPNQIVVAGDASALTKGKFFVDGAGNQANYIEDAEAVADVGEVEQEYRRTDISPFDNLLEDFGVNADLTEFSGGAPVGTVAVGASVISEETNLDNIVYGQKACRISGGIDEGLETINLDLNPTSEEPYFSFWVACKVVSGGYKIELIDSTGAVHPINSTAESTSTTTRALQVAGIEPASGNAQLRIIFTQASSEIILDAWTLVQSPTAYPYTERMGARDLFIEGSRHLRDFGGLTSEIYTVEFYDHSWFEGSSSLEVEIGSYVDVKDAFDPDTSTYGIDFQARVVELEYEETGENGRLRKKAKLARTEDKLSSYFQDRYLDKSTAQSKPVVEVIDKAKLTESAGGGGGELTAQEHMDLIQQVDGYNSGLIADDSGKWEGNTFGTYLNQGVRTTDSPTHAGLTLTGELDMRNEYLRFGGGTSANANARHIYAGFTVTGDGRFWMAPTNDGVSDWGAEFGYDWNNDHWYAEGTFRVIGNLEVTGVIDYVNETNLQVTDKTITVNKNGTDVSADGAGMIVERPSGDRTFLWDATTGWTSNSDFRAVGGFFTGNVTIENSQPRLFFNDTGGPDSSINRFADRFDIYSGDRIELSVGSLGAEQIGISASLVNIPVALTVGGLATVKDDILPDVSYFSNLGSPVSKFATANIAELNVSTLVAQEEVTTTGGRFFVAEASVLTSDLSDVSSTIEVKHNNFASGDFVKMEKGGTVEWMQVTSSASGTGPYTYSVTRAVGPNFPSSWDAGDAIMNTGTTGHGFIDMFTYTDMMNNTSVGPSIAFMYRTGGQYFDVAERAVVGNLKGFYGYAGNEYGIGAGDPSGSYFTVDPTNGVRLIDNGNLAVQLSADNFSVGNMSYTPSTDSLIVGGWDVNPSEIRKLISYAGGGTGTVKMDVGNPRFQVYRNSDGTFVTGEVKHVSMGATYNTDASGNITLGAWTNNNYGILIGSFGNKVLFEASSSYTRIAGWDFSEYHLEKTVGNNRVFLSTNANDISASWSNEPLVTAYNTNSLVMVNVGNIYKNSGYTGFAVFSDYGADEKLVEFSADESGNTIARINSDVDIYGNLRVGAQPSHQNLIGYWAFDTRTEAGTVLDLTGNGLTAERTGSATFAENQFSQGGVVGRYWSAGTGNAEGIGLMNDSEINVYNEQTWLLRFKMSSASTIEANDRIITRDLSDYFSIHTLDSQTGGAWATTTTLQFRPHANNNPVPFEAYPDRWITVVFTLDYNNSTANIYVFDEEQGLYVANEGVMSAGSPSSMNARAVKIGENSESSLKTQVSSSNRFSGLGVDECRFYNKILTKQEAIMLYLNPWGGGQGTRIRGDQVKTGKIISSNWTGQTGARGSMFDLNNGILLMRFNSADVFKFDSASSVAKISGFNIDANAIYKGTKVINGYSSAGNITISSQGGISTENFYIGTDGSINSRKGDLTVDSLKIISGAQDIRLSGSHNTSSASQTTTFVEIYIDGVARLLPIYEPSDTGAPNTPTISKGAFDCESRTITWNGVTDTGTPTTGVDHYDIYRSIDDATFQKINTVTHTGTGSHSFTDSLQDCENGSKFEYYIVAVDGAGNESADSNIVVGTVVGTMPKGVLVFQSAGAEVTISWSDAEYGNPDVDYEIEFDKNFSGWSVLDANVPATNNNYVHSNAGNVTDILTYRIRLVNSGGPEPWQITDSVQLT